jgi:hypothetical protein
MVCGRALIGCELEEKEHLLLLHLIHILATEEGICLFKMKVTPWIVVL